MSTRNTTSHRLMAGFILTSLVGLTACGGGFESNSTLPAAAPAPAPTPTPTPTPTPPPVPPVGAVNPVGEWKFEDLDFTVARVISSATGGFTLLDSLVPSSTTAAKNVFSTVAGKLGNALMMTQDAVAANYPIIKTGNGDYTFAMTPGMSIEMWIRPTGHSASKSDTLVSQTTSSVAGCTYNPSNASGYTFKLNTNGTLVFQLNGNQSLTSASAVADNTWAHVVATYDKTEMKIFINGVMDASTAYTANIASPVASSTGPTTVECSNFKVGGSTTTQSADTGNFQGLMDEFRMYDVGLTNAQVAARFAVF